MHRKNGETSRSKRRGEARPVSRTRLLCCVQCSCPPGKVRSKHVNDVWVGDRWWVQSHGDAWNEASEGTDASWFARCSRCQTTATETYSRSVHQLQANVILVWICSFMLLRTVCLKLCGCLFLLLVLLFS